MKKVLLFVLLFVVICSCNTSKKIECDAYGCNNKVVKKNK